MNETLNPMIAIEALKKEVGLTTDSMCIYARINPVHYRRIRDGIQKPRNATLAKLTLALRRYKLGFGSEAGEIAPFAAMQAVTVLVAFMIKANAKAAINSVPQRRAVQDKAWAEAAFCRQVACHVCNGLLGFRTSDIARAANLSKGAVSLAVRAIEDRRDKDADLCRLLDHLEDIFA